MYIAVCDDNAKDMAEIKTYINEQFRLLLETDYYRNTEEPIAAAWKGENTHLLSLILYWRYKQHNGGVGGIAAFSRRKQRLSYRKK